MTDQVVQTSPSSWLSWWSLAAPPGRVRLLRRRGKWSLAEWLAPSGVRLARLDGMHLSGVAASLPIGVFL